MYPILWRYIKKSKRLLVLNVVILWVKNISNKGIKIQKNVNYIKSQTLQNSYFIFEKKTP